MRTLYIALYFIVHGKTFEEKQKLAIKTLLIAVILSVKLSIEL